MTIFNQVSDFSPMLVLSVRRASAMVQLAYPAFRGTVSLRQRILWEDVLEHRWHFRNQHGAENKRMIYLRAAIQDRIG